LAQTDWYTYLLGRNIGFASFAKTFSLPDKIGSPSPDGLGATIVPAEGPGGEDLGTSLAWFFDPQQNLEPSTNNVTQDTKDRAQKSWSLCQAGDLNKYDSDAGAHTCTDKENQLFWTWADPSDIKKTCTDHSKEVGGVMLWSINQDERANNGGPHIDAIAECVLSMGGGTTNGSSTSADASKSAGPEVTGATV
jgi:GH18 family chitinase